MDPSTRPNIKHDWYQSESHVVINIMAKQVKQENVRVDYINPELHCSGKLPDESDFRISLNLSHPVQTSDIKWKVFPSKIEIKLQKIEGIKWESLEKKADASSTADIVKTYPSSQSQKKDWDKIEQEIKKEEETEKLDGEAALNQLFQKIYADGSDETKKAMNKSFLESGGTVLSTSWNEVGKQKVDVKPPDGMEFKKWD